MDQGGDDGPALYLAHNPIAVPSNFVELIADLARDHRVVTWDPRGTGASRWTGPYDLATDAEDLAALVAKSLGPGVMISPGLTASALVIVEAHPDLVAAVVLLGGVPRLAWPESGEPGIPRTPMVSPQRRFRW